MLFKSLTYSTTVREDRVSGAGSGKSTHNTAVDWVMDGSISLTVVGTHTIWGM